MTSKNSSKEEYKPNTGNLAQRLARVAKTRWIRFGIVAAIYIAWTIWLGTWWVILFFPLLADIYLTQFIPWTWWKKSKSKVVHTVMGWVDAILYALVLVYFIFIFIGQNYQIPSSSLEKTLLVGDYLWVNKLIYGPRVPQTPVHFPLTQHTFPIINTKSYLDYPQWSYHRLKGIRKIERNDIVVFNFPAGDTVALKVPNPDYYTLINQYGRDVVKNNPDQFGEIIYRPVDRRENYVKRAIGLPGDYLSIKKNIVYIDGKPLKEPENIQYNYLVQTDGRQISDDTWDELGVSNEDQHYIPVETAQDGLFFASIGMKTNSKGDMYPIYQVPLTKAMIAKIKSYGWITTIEPVPVQEQVPMYPITHNYGWTRADYGPIWIPKKGGVLKLNLNNLPIYERAIKNYEGNDLEVKDGKIMINGKEATTYKFKMDYYWMMGDNRDNSADSRFWGFVPEDHVVGSPMIVLISLDKDKSLLKGGFRWNRVFKPANPDK